MKNHLSYTTERELLFIDGLGTGTFQDPKNKYFYVLASRLSLLVGYKKALKLRVSWEDLDRKAIYVHIEKSIQKELTRKERR